MAILIVKMRTTAHILTWEKKMVSGEPANSHEEDEDDVGSMGKTKCACAKPQYIICFPHIC